MRVAAATLLVLSAMAGARGEARDLEAMVGESDLVARVRVLGTRPLEPGEHPHLRSEAHLEILEAFRGIRLGEVARLRFEHGACRPDALFAPGEECLLMAKADFEGSFVTLDDGEGKLPVDPALISRIKTLCERRGPEVVLDGRISLRVRPGTAGALGADEAVLDVRVENRGREPLEIANELTGELRFSPGGRQLVLLSELRKVSREIEVTLVFETEDSGEVLNVLMERRGQVQTISLGPSEACEGSITVRDALPSLEGKHHLTVWAAAGGRLSNWLSLEVDFGGPRELVVIPRSSAARPPEPEGPFRKVGPLQDLLRFARRNALLLSLFAAALVLGSLAKLRPGRGAAGK